MESFSVVLKRFFMSHEGGRGPWPRTLPTCVLAADPTQIQMGTTWCHGGFGFLSKESLWFFR